MNNSKLRVEKSKITGKGIYATKDIKKDETIFLVKGNILEFEPEDYSWSVPHAISYAKNKWLNPYQKNPLRYTNHSCDANAILGKGLRILALKNIKKDEEITVDYSLTEEDKDWCMTSPCRCGAKNCRKKITNIHELPKKIFLKYKPYIRRWIVDSYEKDHNIKE